MLLLNPVFGQPNRLLGLRAATGVDLINFVDDAFSPALINGQLHYNELGVQYESPLYLMRAELGYAYGNLPIPFRFNHTARGNLDVQRKFIKNEKLTGFLGLSFSSLTQFRRLAVNNGLNVSLLYESTIGLGPSFNLYYLSRNLDGFEFSLRLPMATFYIDRPYELIDNYAIDGQNRPNIIKAWKFSGIGPIFHLNLRTTYHIHIDSLNRLSLIYNWEYNRQKVGLINQFRGAHHGMLLQYTKYFTLKDKAND